MGVGAAGQAAAAYTEGVGYFAEGIASSRAAKFNEAITRVNTQAEVDALENQAQQAEIIAQMADEDAKLARQATAFAVRQQRLAFAQAQGQTRGAIGASGVTFEGTPLHILAEQSYQAGLEIWKTQFTGKLAEREARSRASEARFQAELLRFGGRRAIAVGEQQIKMLKFGAKMARTASYIKVAGSVLSSMGAGMSGMSGGGGASGGSGAMGNV